MDLTDIRKILITRTDRLGDVVLSTPIARFLRKKYPNAHIAFMVRPYTKEVLSGNPDIDEVIIYDKYGKHKNVLSTLKFALMIKKKKFDMAIALHPTNRVHFILFAAGIPVRAGYDKKMGRLLTIKMPHEKQKGHMHEIDYNFDLLNKMGLDIEGADRLPYIATEQPERALIDELLAEKGITGDMIVIHAGASCASKRWPVSKFVDVIEKLSKDQVYDFILVGDESTKNINSDILSHFPDRIHDFTGMLKIKDLAELLSRAKVFISNDSGPVHVSVAVGTPVVCIFGRKDPGLSPKRWGPVGEKDRILHGDAGCDECLAHNCMKNFVCLEAVNADDVVKASRIIMSEPKGEKPLPGSMKRIERRNKKMELKDIISGCDAFTIYEERQNTDEYIEIVFLNDEKEKWHSVFIDFFGDPSKPEGMKPSKEHVHLTEEYGGICRNQVLYVKSFEDGKIIAMFWPWQDNEHTTLKLILKKA